jgi:hypothetical protein
MPMRGGLDCEKFAYSEPDPRKENFEILNMTRFNFRSTRNDNKRNDIMIEGIGRFVRENKIERGLKVTFFEKGEDTPAAKALCESVGIERFVSWQKVVKLNELIPFFRNADVAFDQLGSQWVGSGVYSMLVGRPLIANGRPELLEPFQNEVSPVCQATTVEEVSRWLTALYLDRSLVRSVGRASSDYIRKHYDVNRDVDFYLDQIDHFSAKRTRS